MIYTDEENQAIDRVVEMFSKSRTVLFITGAGVSADSGLPTYRGIGGLYEEEDTEEGVPIEVALSAEMLHQNPALTWKYLNQIGRATSGAQFNRAHEVIAEMEAHFRKVWVLTQNIDGYHTHAGSKNVIEAHGNMYELFCMKCDRREHVEKFAEMPLPPKCEHCGGNIRPGVVLFGEMLPADAVEGMGRLQMYGPDLVVSVGTTSVFPYIAHPVMSAARDGRHTVEINPGLSNVSNLVDIHLKLGAAKTLDTIWERLQRLTQDQSK